MIVIKIGHSAYKGTNALRYCFSKAQAIRVLRNRGMSRNTARLAIKKLTAHKPYSSQIYKNDCVSINYQICELADMSAILNDPKLRNRFGYIYTPKQMKLVWKNVSEF